MSPVRFTSLAIGSEVRTSTVVPAGISTVAGCRFWEPVPAVTVGGLAGGGTCRGALGSTGDWGLPRPAPLVEDVFCGSPVWDPGALFGGGVSAGGFGIWLPGDELTSFWVDG